MLYLDNSATTMPYPEVISTFTQVTKDYFANPSSLHKLGSEAESLLTETRKQVAHLLGVDEQEIVFTSGGTEGNNLAIKGAAFANKNNGKHLITSLIEHPSVLETFKQLEEVFGFEVTYLPVDEHGYVTCDKLKQELRDDTILVSIMHVNNEVGTIQPINEIGELLRAYPNILFHVDHVQGVAKVPLDFKRVNIDLCTISGHKFHGLNGTGALFVRKGVQLLPIFTGGSQELQLRSGTESLAGNIALAKALRMSMEQFKEKQSTLKEIQTRLMRELIKMDGVIVNTPFEQVAPHIINFSVPKVKAEVLVHYLSEHNIFVSTTSACSSRRKSISHTLVAMNKSQDIATSSIRVSLSFEQSKEIIAPFIERLSDGIIKLSKVMR
ncbi:cysteine desulfurase family protein [Metabacillus niabensis]|uniref:Cysteine desulfurase n=1 Tax=Metabacillus niabensis TaxID=324854 RepID=A0ABT9YY93_9BACI|nr:cysteine desulfurase family protein [Metabacillus niabensis]MDQ0224586.1 cysteine desulfurase [Metabacillus niabensis]